MDPRTAAEACFTAEGFDIDGRLDFWVDPRSGSLAFRPLVATPEGGFDVRAAPVAIDGREVSLEERERVLVRCVERIRGELDLPAAALPVDRELDADRAARLETCLRRAGVRSWVDDLRLREGLDGSGPIVDTTTGPLADAQVEILNAAVVACLGDLDGRPDDPNGRP